MQEAGRVDIGDEGPIAERKLGALVAPQRLADAAVLDDRRKRAAAELRLLDQLDRVDDLDVAGAAAEVPVDKPGDLGAGQPLALVGDPFDAEDEARRAEPALQAGGRLESVGVEAALVVGNAFEGDDRAALDLLGAHRAGELRLTVEQDQAGAAFALRRTARLDGLDRERLAQGLDQQPVGFGLELTGLAVERELDRLHLVRHRRAADRTAPTRSRGADHPALARTRSVVAADRPPERQSRLRQKDHELRLDAIAREVFHCRSRAAPAVRFRPGDASAAEGAPHAAQSSSERRATCLAPRTPGRSRRPAGRRGQPSRPHRGRRAGPRPRRRLDARPRPRRHDRRDRQCRGRAARPRGRPAGDDGEPHRHGRDRRAVRRRARRSRRARGRRDARRRRRRHPAAAGGRLLHQRGGRALPARHVRQPRLYRRPAAGDGAGHRRRRRRGRRRGASRASATPARRRSDGRTSTPMSSCMSSRGRRWRRKASPSARSKACRGSPGPS